MRLVTPQIFTRQAALHVPDPLLLSNGPTAEFQNQPSDMQDQSLYPHTKQALALTRRMLMKSITWPTTAINSVGEVSVTQVRNGVKEKIERLRR
jgi:hypothetical protein